MNSSSRPVLVGKRRGFPWAIIPPLLVVLLAAGLWFWRSGSDQGQRLIAGGNYEQAIQVYDSAISSNPNDPDAYVGRAQAYAGSRDFERAAADYTKAIELGVTTENLPVVYNNRGLAYFGMDQDDLALADYSKAIELRPDYATAYINRALLHARRERNDEAIADYTKAIELNGQTAEPYLGRAQVYADQGNQEAALADYTKAIDLNSKLASAYGGRADIYLARGERDKALADLRAAVANAGVEDELLKNRAEAQIQTLENK